MALSYLGFRRVGAAEKYLFVFIYLFSHLFFYFRRYLSVVIILLLINNFFKKGIVLLLFSYFFILHDIYHIPYSLHQI